MSLVAVAGVAVMAIYWWINKYVLTDPRYYNPEETKSRKRKTQNVDWRKLGVLVKIQVHSLLDNPGYRLRYFDQPG